MYYYNATNYEKEDINTIFLSNIYKVNNIIKCIVNIV